MDEPIDVDDVMAQVRQTTGDPSAVESALGTARRQSAAHERWPARLEVFPFSRFPVLRRAVLRVVRLVSKPQHEVNSALIDASAEMFHLERTLGTRIAMLEERLRVLEARCEGAQAPGDE